ncbi:MAG: DUF4249 family protein [Bacteroidota bacterium]
MKNSIIFLLTISLLAACTPEPLDIDIRQAETKPVVATQYYFDTITQQSALIVTLTKTLTATTGNRPQIDSNGFIVDQDYLVANAIVELSTSTGTITLEEVSPGFYYAFNVELLDHEHCRVNASNTNGETIVSAETEVMAEVDFTSLSLSGPSSDRFINYTLTDNPGTPNWYLVNYLTKQQKDTANYNDPKYIARRLTEQKLDFDLFTDSDFKNGTMSVSRKLENLQYDTIAIAVSNINKGYYDFLLTQKRYGLLVNQLKGEVINFPTNIKGGLGYFQLSRPKLRVLDVNDR